MELEREGRGQDGDREVEEELYGRERRGEGEDRIYNIMERFRNL